MIDNDLFLERAAIIEFDGKVSREHAEQLARKQLREAQEKREMAPLLAAGLWS